MEFEEFFRIFHKRKVMGKVFPIFFSSFFYFFAISLISPIYSVYIESVVESVFLTGLIISLYGLMNVVFAIPFGILCDRWNLKKVMRYSFYPFIFVPLLYYLSSNFLQIFVVRVVQGVAGTLFWIAFWAYAYHNIKKKYAGEEIEIYTMLRDFSKSIAPLIGGIIATYSLFYNFYLASALYFVAFLLIVFEVDDIQDGSSDHGEVDFVSILGKELSEFKKLVMDNQMFFFAYISSYGLLIFILSFLPLLMKEAGMPFTSIGIVMTIAFLPPIFFHLVIGKVVDSKGRGIVFAIGLLLLSISLFILSFPLRMVSILFAIVAFGFSQAFIFISSSTIFSDISDGSYEGIISGSRKLIMGIATVGGPLVGGYMLDSIPRGMVFLILGLFSISCTLTFLFRREDI